MPREAKDIAMAIGVDFRLRTGAADEWIVRRNAAIVAQPQHLADVTAEILGAHPETPIVADDVSVAVADSHIHHAVGAELAAACNRTARFPGVGHEYVAEIGEYRAVETPPREGQRRAPLAFFLVRKIDQVVLHEFRMHENGVEGAGVHSSVRHARDRFWIQDAIADYP
jgi:hypothetical protein